MSKVKKDQIVAAVPNVVRTNIIRDLYILSSWINLVMLQLYKLSPKEGLLAVLVFLSLWLLRLFTFYVVKRILIVRSYMYSIERCLFPLA